ncbi:MAG TPA: TRL-like family protein [Sunxiuqinia sp.]|nr:TRL-like family protein [Sunxiuqinia sp.]
MKKAIKGALILFSIALFFTSCAAVKSPLLGSLYTDVKAPVAVTSNSNSSKVGSAEATSILGLVATGDASIEAAAKSAGITKIHHVDEYSTSILGVYATYTVYVYGE